MQDSGPNTYLVTKKPDISYVIKKYELKDNNNLKLFKKYIPYCGPSCQSWISWWYHIACHRPVFLLPTNKFCIKAKNYKLIKSSQNKIVVSQ